MSGYLPKWRSKAEALLREFFHEDRVAVRVLAALLFIDLLFLVIHGVKYAFKEDFIAFFGYWIYRNLTLTNDWAMPEIFNYLKFAAIVYLLCRIYTVIKQPIYIGWAFVYAVSLLDDSLQIHEALGEYIGNEINGLGVLNGILDEEKGFRIRDLGELVVYAMYGGTFVLVLGVSFLLSDPVHRLIGAGFALLLGLLAFFAVGVDLLARAVPTQGVMGTLEDAGEMWVISLTVVYALAVYRKFSAPPGS